MEDLAAVTRSMVEAHAGSDNKISRPQLTLACAKGGVLWLAAVRRKVKRFTKPLNPFSLRLCIEILNSTNDKVEELFFIVYLQQNPHEIWLYRRNTTIQSTLPHKISEHWGNIWCALSPLSLIILAIGESDLRDARFLSNHWL